MNNIEIKSSELTDKEKEERVAPKVDISIKNLDEKGFVFLDKNHRPFWCCLYFEEPWLFYWHPDNKWVTLRKVTQSEILAFPRNLTEKHQKCYFK